MLRPLASLLLQLLQLLLALAMHYMAIRCMNAACPSPHSRAAVAFSLDL